MIPLTRSVQVFQGTRWRALKDWEAPLARAGIGPDGGWLDLEQGELVSRSPSTRCFRLTLDSGEVVYFKRYRYAVKKWLEFWLRPGKAAVEAFGYARLASLGIPSLDVVAFGEQRLFGMLQAAFLVTRAVPDSLDLARFAQEVWRPLPPPERRRLYREIAGQLLLQLQRAHGAGFFHHDLKWRNILIQRQGDRLVPVWIDCPRAEERSLFRRRGVVVDLSGLARLALGYCSLRDRYRFVRDYLGPEAERGAAKALFRAVKAHLDRRPPTNIVSE